jgi:hypothetical protein
MVAVTPASGGAAGGLLAAVAATAAVVLTRGRRSGRYSGAAAPVVGARAGQAASAFGHEKPPIEPAPPADLRPGHAGTLLNAVITHRDVTATILDLAVRRYPRIEDARRSGHHLRLDWRLVRLNKSGACWSTSRYCWMACSRARRSAPARQQRGFPTSARLRRAAQAGPRRPVCRRGRARLVHRPPRPGPPHVAGHRSGHVRGRRGSGDRGSGRHPPPGAGYCHVSKPESPRPAGCAACRAGMFVAELETCDRAER